MTIPASATKANRLRELLLKSPNYFHFCFNRVRLLPHQVAIYKSILARWPINGLIADEVGLGKTIEAGAIISYAIRFLHVGRTALLVPASLRGQWQSEMYNLFGLKFYIYEPEKNRLAFYLQNELAEEIPDVFAGGFFDHGAGNIIFSWHYLRQTDANGRFRLSSEDKIDMLVVDEAHGARLIPQVNGDNDSTRLRQLLSQLVPVIPHKLLLTATPFQTSIYDYISLLNLLYGEDGVHEDSLRRIAMLNKSYRLNNQQKVDAVSEMAGNLMYNLFQFPSEADLGDPAVLLGLYDEDAYLKSHQTTIYTVRNTRDQLKAIGYIFPQSTINSKAVELNVQQLGLQDLINTYIENHLFSFETAIGTKGLGFVKTVYGQRIVSSFQACYDTLQARVRRLEDFIRTGQAQDSVVVSSNEDDVELVVQQGNTVQLSPAEISIGRTEIEYVREILSKIETRLFTVNEIVDPKIEEVVRLVREHLAQEDKVIIFSRFTSTTAFVVERFKQMNEFSFGRFEGEYKQIISGGVVEDVSRDSIARRFKGGEFPVIVCSDAASEGLNLQSANVLINIDVPWNPARVLQRFGRIDRFGQQKESLHFYNLFYPNTIEDAIYARLHRRNLDFRELLGTTPDITSRAHLRSLMISRDEDTTELSYKNTLLALVDADNMRPHQKILARLDPIDEFSIGPDTILYQGIAFGYSTDEMSSSYLDLNHPLFAQIQLNSEFFVGVFNRAGDLLFIGIQNSEMIYPILGLESILDQIILRKWVNPSVPIDGLSANALERELPGFLERNAKLLINHLAIIFNNALENDLYKGLHIKVLSFS